MDVKLNSDVLNGNSRLESNAGKNTAEVKSQAPVFSKVDDNEPTEFVNKGVDPEQVIKDNAHGTKDVKTDFINPKTKKPFTINELAVEIFKNGVDSVKNVKDLKISKMEMDGTITYSMGDFSMARTKGQDTVLIGYTIFNKMKFYVINLNSY